MKGLLLEIYYKNIKNIFIMNAFLILVWILINLFADIQMVVFAYFAVVIFANSLLLLLSQRKDYDLRLYKYEFMLPIKSKNIILSKYISQVVIILFSILMLIILNYISIYLGKHYFDYGSSDLISLLNVLLGLILQLVSIFYLAMYFIDLEKGDLWIVLGLIGSIVLVSIEIFALNRLGFSKSDGNIVLFIIYLVIFSMSFALNSKKMENLKLDV
ncbi:MULTISPECIES: ABC-2 transporter permease [Peptoniphilus]|uniref:ABC-2 transporter permease n=1 Tax=Peptoniphilus TaxID=162289 RepID=UPI0003B82C82|nr:MULTISPECIES: ABC-2 transporter permease [Peptoniphilus]ERT63788.1 ABC-2 family transporter protein [Peptoniphilus sp. BV3AC2]